MATYDGVVSRAIAYVTASTLVVGVGGTELVKNFEGLRQKAYYDAVGVPTICYGHTQGVKIGHTKTVAECEFLLGEELQRRGAEVGSLVKVPISTQQYEAMVSLQYNIGQRNFKNSTLLKKLNQRDYCGAANQFPRWSYAGGKKLKGLETRRNRERAYFLSGTKEKC